MQVCRIIRLQDKISSLLSSLAALMLKCKKIFQEIHHDTLHRTYHTLQIRHNLQNLRRLEVNVTLITEKVLQKEM